jgi:hypothetical protein
LIDGRNEAEKSALARAAIEGSDGRRLYRVQPHAFLALPGEPLAYWFPESALELFDSAPSLGERGRAAIGMITGDNSAYLRRWFEVPADRIGFGLSPDMALASSRKWFPYAKGGDFRRWAGNYEYVVNWQDGGAELQTKLTDDGSRIRAHNFNLDRILRPGITWTVVAAARSSFRIAGDGFLFDAAAGIFQSDHNFYHLALLNSAAADFLLRGLNPTVNLHPGYLSALPAPDDPKTDYIDGLSRRAVAVANEIWDSDERSWGFEATPALAYADRTLEGALQCVVEKWLSLSADLADIQEEVDLHFADLYGVVGAPEGDSPPPPEGEECPGLRELITALISYFVGCTFGRYSLDLPGVILANQGATMHDYLAKIPVPTFVPGKDNVIPIVDGDWFEDDIVARFRTFLRAAFGEKDFEENLRFVTESLGVKNIRDYFVRSFYKDHVQRYKKRPIYWLFSSPKGSFNALIYMHRYTPSTASTVLNEYLREFQAKLSSSLQQQERLVAGGGTPRQMAAAQKEADRVRKVLLELEEYEHDVLYPVASRQVAIDLDDGVKANYPKFGAALKKIVGLEASDD